MIRWIEKYIGVFFNLNAILWLTEASVRTWRTFSYLFSFFTKNQTNFDHGGMSYFTISYLISLFSFSILSFKRIYLVFPLIFLFFTITLPLPYNIGLFYQLIDLKELFEKFTNYVYLESYLSTCYYSFLLILSFIGMILLARVLLMKKNRFYKR